MSRSRTLRTLLYESFEKFKSSRHTLAITIIASGFVAGAVVSTASAEETRDKRFVDEFMDAMIHGKISLDVRFRWENAKIDGLNTSNASTVRTRLGYGTKSLYGLSGFLEFENVASPAPSAYFDGLDPASSRASKTIVADPEVTEANRFWLLLDKKDWGHSKLKVGRQRIKLDDDRWVGNVGWRQNEQTYDAVRLQTQLGRDDLLVQYTFGWENNTIFGDQGVANRRDYGMKTHLMNVSYDVSEALRATGFIYLIDANDPFAGNSSNTYGLRATGMIPISDDLTASYEVSWAWQTDAATNPADYGAHYYHLVGGMKMKSVGLVKLGYEVLGSDDGKGRVVTPLATLHKFNGFADAFLDNGGVRGLRDVYVVLSPALPLEKVALKFVFHQFYSDQGGDDLGQEYDLVASYQFNKYLSFTYKLAYYDEGESGSPESRVRNSLQTTFRF